VKRLEVHWSGRQFQTEHGEPFFYLGDTAWELIHRLKEAEVHYFLDRLAGQGFNVGQTVGVPGINGLTTPNAYGDLPFIDGDPAQPNDRYFDWVEWVVDQAAKRKMYVGLLPTWGSYAVEENHALFPNPCVFNPDNALAYGRYLSGRFWRKPNIIWILGGDREPDSCLETWRAMALGLNARGNGQLVTYHPSGGQSSSRLLHTEDWLSFNLFQSGHSSLSHPDQQAFDDIGREPAKPVINGEPSYEAAPNTSSRHGEKLDDAEVRRCLYASVFSGACGFTYGCNEVWMMWEPRYEPIAAVVNPPFLDAELPWYEALDRPGAWQMSAMVEIWQLPRIFEAMPQFSRIKNNEGIYAFGHDAWTIVWTPGRTVVFHDPPAGRALWVSPRNGAKQQALMPFNPPDERDWILFVSNLVGGEEGAEPVPMPRFGQYQNDWDRAYV